MLLSDRPVWIFKYVSGQRATIFKLFKHAVSVRPPGQTHMQKKRLLVPAGIVFQCSRDPHCDSVSRRAISVQSGNSDRSSHNAVCKKNDRDETKWVLVARESAAECHGYASAGRGERWEAAWCNMQPAPHDSGFFPPPLSCNNTPLLTLSMQKLLRC